MNQRGQALIETAIVVLLIAFLTTTLMRAAYLTWANLVVDRETHRLAICTLQSRNRHFCQSFSRTQLPKLLFGFGEIKKCRSQLQREISGFEYSRAEILVSTNFGLVKSIRTLDEVQIQQASRRWR